MNWRSFLVRVLLVIVAFPVIAILIFVLPHLHHAVLNLFVVLATTMGAMEMAALFKDRGIPTSPILAPLLAAAFPVGAWLEVSGYFPPSWIGMWIPVAVGTLLVRAVFFRKGRTLSTVLAFASSSVFTFFYPGFFPLVDRPPVRASRPVVEHPLLPLPRVRQRHGSLFRRQPLGSFNTAESRGEPAQEHPGVSRRVLPGSLIVVGIFVIAVPVSRASGSARAWSSGWSPARR